MRSIRRDDALPTPAPHERDLNLAGVVQGGGHAAANGTGRTGVNVEIFFRQFDVVIAQVRRRRQLPVEDMTMEWQAEH